MGDDAIRFGATVGGAGLGALAAPFTGGLSIPVMAGLGGALGAGASTAGTGGSTRSAILNSILGGAGGFGAGTLAAPSIASLMAPTAPTATSWISSLATGGPSLAPGMGVLDTGMDIGKGFSGVLAPGAGVTLGEDGIAGLAGESGIAKGASALADMFSKTTMKDALGATYGASMLNNMLGNGVHRQLSPGPVSGLTIRPAGGFDAFAVPYRQPQIPQFHI